MKTLVLIPCLLLTYYCYCFDTIQVRPSFKGLKEVANGTLVYQNIHLNKLNGNVVLHIPEVNPNIQKENIRIKAETGIQLVELNLIKPIQKKISVLDLNLDIQNEINELKETLKTLETRETEVYQLKKEMLAQDNTSIQLKQINHYFKKKNNEIRLERIETFKKMRVAQEKMNQIRNKIGISKRDTFKHLYIHLLIKKLATYNLELSYLLLDSIAYKDSIGKPRYNPELLVLKGRVIETSQGFPIMFAAIECYQNKELIEVVHTDENGLFELKVPAKGIYQIEVVQEGYKDRKLRNIPIGTQQINYRTISLRSKENVSALEFLSYALPLVDILQSNW